VEIPMLENNEIDKCLHLIKHLINNSWLQQTIKSGWTFLRLFNQMFFLRERTPFFIT